MERIHEAALELLETVGLGQAIPSCIETADAPRAAFMNEQGRLCFPRASSRTRSPTARAISCSTAAIRSTTCEPWGNKVYFGTAGAAVHIVDVETRTYREFAVSPISMTARASSISAITSISTSAASRRATC